MSLRVANKLLNDVSVDDWKFILEHGSFRGYKINRLAQAMATQKGNDLSCNIGNGKVSYKTYTLDLNRIKHCPSKWSFSRLSYWFKVIFGVDQSKHKAEIDHLAHCIYDKLQEETPAIASNTIGILNRDLFLIKNALVHANKTVADPEYFEEKEGSDMFALWFHEDRNSIEIQKGSEFIHRTHNQKLTFVIDSNGKFESLLVDGNRFDNLKDVPPERQSWLSEALKKAIDLVSSYGLSKNKKFIELKTIRRGINKAPLIHLNKLGDQIQDALKHATYPLMDVHLMKDDLSKAKGSDNGGIARDYLNCLVESTMEDSGLPFQSVHPSGLHLPAAKQASDELFIPLSGEEMTIYQNMGKVMMYCYRSQPNTEDYKNYQYITGQHLHEALFAGAFSLTAEEIKTPFVDLKMQTKINMCHAILSKLEYGNWSSLLKEILNWKNEDPIPDLHGEALELADAYLDEMTCIIDSEKVNANPEEYVYYLKKQLMNYRFAKKDSCPGIALGALLSPIHAIAQGLKSIGDIDGNWDGMGMDSLAFSEKVQGALDREAIVKAFKYKGEGSIPTEIKKKIEWLKSWIQDTKTSDKAVRKFLVYMTGANSLPKDQGLFYGSQVQNPSLIPTAVTCQHLILINPVETHKKIYSDRTREGFIEIIENFIVNDTSVNVTMD